MVSVIFVCLGNICRSPMAEAIFQQLVDDAGLSKSIQVDSAGTGSWHVGERAHRGTREVLAQRGIRYEGRARRVTQGDMDPGHYVIAMDGSNLSDLKRRFGDHPRLFRLLEFATIARERDVPDPYYTGSFARVAELVSDGCRGLLAMICREEGLSTNQEAT